MKPLFSLFAKTPVPTAPAAEPPPAAPAPAPAPVVPSRRVEGRREFRGLLWLPVLEVSDDEKLVVSARAGLPHCLRCERALSLAAGPREEWECGGCGDKRPGSEVDFFATDSVVAEGLKAFFAENPGFRPAPGLSAPLRALAASA